MSVHVFYSLPSLIETIEQLPPEKSVISFDVFDTLLVRRIHEPDLLKQSVSRYLLALAAKRDLHFRADGLLAKRNEIEARQRQRHGKLHPDFEAYYPELIRKWVAYYFPEADVPEVTEQVMAYELELESKVLVPRKGWKDLLQKLQAQGRTLIALSDMYLPGEMIRVLLDRAGLLEYFNEVHSSADSMRAKASGEGFHRLIELQGISPKEWVHVGDNAFSDALVPDSLGITAFSLRDVSERKRKSVLQRYHLSASQKPFWYGRYIQQMAMPLEEELDDPQFEDALYREGYGVFGPLLAGFMAGLLERCREQKLEVVYFLSREGKVFQQIWDRMIPILAEGGFVPEVRYLHVSRKALGAACCGIRGLTRELVETILLPMENRDFRDVCHVTGLDVEACLPFLQAHGMAADTPLSGHHEGFHPRNWESLMNLLEDQGFQKEVRRQKQDDAEGLIAYLESISFFTNPHVGMVDVGWLGSIQKLFFDCIRDRNPHPVLHGQLLCASYRVPFHTRVDNRLEGWIYQHRKGEIYAGAMMMYQELFEELCRPGEPGLQGYSKATGGYLKFRDRSDEAFQLEMKQTEAFASLQQGVFDVSERMALALIMGGESPRRMRPWLSQMLAVKLAFPRTAEVLNLRHRHHVNDLSNQNAAPVSLKSRCLGRLWDNPPARLRWVPLLRHWYFLKHVLFELIHPDED
ncbi:HAD family hydrolase [Kiritimatiellaeota bacterium B1221]|nr:HAD family hydrolase [Kiritimatiellaeota bacterium B1221]